GGRDAGQGQPSDSTGSKLGLVHPETREDALTREFFEWKRRDAAHDLAEHLEPHIRIQETRPGSRNERLPVFPFKDLLRGSEIESHRVVSGQARPVREQLFDRDLIPLTPARGELGNELRDAILEPDLSALDER